MADTRIEYATKVWNPITGCTHSGSPGCDHCWAASMVKRFPQLHGIRLGDTKWENLPYSEIRFHPHRLDEPLRWRKPQRVFVGSMTDLFHPDVSVTWLESVLATITLCPQHTFMILTKRPERFLLLTKDRLRISRTDTWPIKNLYLGVTAENQEMANLRIPILLQTPAAKRFISAEPLLGPIDLSKYIGYNPKYETTQQGNFGIRSGEVGTFGNNAGRDHLEIGGDEREQMEQSHHYAANSAPSSRTRSRTISTGTSDDREKTSDVLGTSVGVDTLQWSHCREHDDQPQEWEKEGQQAGKLGDSNILGKHETCVQDGIERRVWSKESKLQTDGRSNRGDQNNLFNGDQESDGIGKGISSNLPDHFEDSSGRQSGKTRRDQSGLHISTPIRRGETQQQGTISLCIVGSESGPSRRPCDIDWIRSLRDQCVAAGVPFFLKQMSVNGKLVKMPLLDGKRWAETPKEER